MMKHRITWPWNLRWPVFHYLFYAMGGHLSHLQLKSDPGSTYRLFLTDLLCLGCELMHIGGYQRNRVDFLGERGLQI